jgi:8-oxo-dGTP pyrophosphatase MutT (NUDIX family)/predicted HAD superfamily Cof-like phosphohydrolase
MTVAPQVQRLAAYALIRRTAEVLLTRISPRGHHVGSWTLPGGGVDHGEEPRSALARELVEETGLRVKIGALLDVHSHHFTGKAPPHGHVEDFHGIHLIFDASLLDPQQVPQVTEQDGTSDAVGWVRVAQIQSGEVPVLDVVRHALAVPAAARQPSEMVREFHRAFNRPVAAVANPRPPQWEDRISFLQEEFDEYVEAARAGDLAAVADALADMIYVIHGTALAYGIPLEEVLVEVHRSNMSKLGADGRPNLRADGKVVKGPEYVAPDIAAIVHRAADRSGRG